MNSNNCSQVKEEKDFMKNYVLMYKLSDKRSGQLLEEKIKRSFPRNRVFIDNGLKYFSFAARELPGVRDKLQEIMDELILLDPDYIALYYTREEEPDIINRLMIFGTSDLFERDIERISGTIQDNILADLLEINFMKPK